MTEDRSESVTNAGHSDANPVDMGSAWLQTPPDGPAPKAPVDTRNQALPLSDLSWQDFERLILRLVRREGPDVECAVYGTPGQAQGGIDILATHAEQASQPLCYQCKKVTTFGPADVVAAVDAFLAGPWKQTAREFVLCVSLPLESTALQDAMQRQRTRLAEQNIKFSVWDGAPAGALQERLKDHPDLVDDFFGRAWVESFQGAEVAVRLGERLNGYELDTLRKRLLTLYAVLFQQHDPGLRPDGVHRFDYRDRYVTAEVIERIQVDVGDTRQQELPPTNESSESVAERSSHEAAATAVIRSTTYEARRPVFDWLRDQRQCLLLGEAGYGKSAALRYLALSILQPERLSLDTLDPEYFSCLPVWLSFARFSAAIKQQSTLSPADFFRDWLHQHSFDDVYPLFQRAARAGQILLLVDGLDEAVTEQAGREALDRILTFLPSADASIICTSRPQSYRILGVPPTWTTATLTPLSDAKIEELATRWFTILEAPVDTGGGAGLEAASWGRDRAQAFVRVARDSPRTLELARNPLLCQSLIQIFRFSHQLPEARITVYQQIVELLLSKHPAARVQAGAGTAAIAAMGLKSAEVKEVLIRLAWTMQSHPGGTLPRRTCEQVCTDFLMDDTYGLGEPRARARRMAGDLIDQLATNYGVLVERTPGEFGLLHLSLQGYLAAESVARMAQQEQLNWLARIWTHAAWRESLLAWFGILGDRGDKLLAARAAQHLAVFGEAGEWQRLQALELRTQIATSDLGLPVSEARSIVEQAIGEVETTPFIELRTALARCIALGALDTSVRHECQHALQRWLPGRSDNVRLRLLEAFQAWQPSAALRTTLLRGLLDPYVLCRRAAAETFLTVFAADAQTRPTLEQLAIHHLQPEVRAAVLHGLGTRPAWAELAHVCATANAGATHAELFLAVVRVRIAAGEHTEQDLERLWTLWNSREVEFSIRDELVDLLCEGWPRHTRLRENAMRCLSQQWGPVDIDLPLIYLIRCYPGDEDVAGLVVQLLEQQSHGLLMHEVDIWDALWNGFRGHPRIAAALRTLLQEQRDKYPSIYWDPRTAAAMAVLGDEAARDELLASYATADLRGRYWIASALHRGWLDDVFVRVTLTQWASDDINLAAPLTRWAEVLFPDRSQRQAWLQRLARATAETRDIGALVLLLEQWPDEATRQLVEPLLEEPQLWYYHRVMLQGLYTRAFPTVPRSLEILERSLDELDGPNPGSFAAAFEHPIEVATRLLTAAVPATADVRLAVTSVLRERAVDLETVIAATPSPLAEADSAVRASGLMARARAVRRHPDARTELSQVLLTELDATGSYMDVRRRSALSGLLELDAYDSIAASFASQQGRGWQSRLVDFLHQDAVSIGTLVKHWVQLKPLLLQQGLETQLPISEMVRLGYEGLLEHDPELQRELDEYFRLRTPDLIGADYFEAFARRQPHSERLRSLLLQVIAGDHQGSVACAAARVLAAQFSSPQDVWPELASVLGTPQAAAQKLADGVLGHLALGWPDGAVAAWADTLSASEVAQLPLRDGLLVTLARQDEVKAETAAAALLTEPRQPWQHSIEDSHALRVWARSNPAGPCLARWLSSDQPSLSITALALMAGERRDLDTHVEALIECFNAQCLPTASAPLQGLNAVSGRHEGWAITVYAALRAWRRTTP